MSLVPDAELETLVVPGLGAKVTPAGLICKVELEPGSWTLIPVPGRFKLPSKESRNRKLTYKNIQTFNNDETITQNISSLKLFRLNNE